MAVKIATAPCSWGVWYADGTPSGTPAQLFLDQARQAALDYYAGTVFDVTELVFEEQMANTVSFTVQCSKGGVRVDPDRAIVLECTDGGWTVISEGY